MPAPTADHAPVSVALVGAGPRGTSVLERLCASAPELLPPGARLRVHVIDPSPPGPGHVWRTTQSPELLMNTVASQVTLFTDDSVDCSGPIRQGPSLYEWARGEATTASGEQGGRFAEPPEERAVQIGTGTEQPRTGTEQPRTGTRQPGAGAPQPEAKIRQEEVRAGQPEAKTRQPEVRAAGQPVGDAGPEGDARSAGNLARQPEGETPQPGAGAGQPRTGTRQPGAGAAQPGAGTRQAGAGTRLAEVRAGQPEAKARQPEVRAAGQPVGDVGPEGDAGSAGSLARQPEGDSALGPDDYPTRAHYGRYLAWVFGEAVRNAPGVVEVVTHAARAVRLDDAGDGTQSLTLDDGRTLPGLAAVVLAQGHLPLAADRTQRRLAAYADAHGLRHVPPANPADVDLSAVRPGEPVLLRGLGLNFFDHMALLTTGRGGRFTRTDRGLRYHPSGNEPRLYAGSRRGIPYQARGDNAKGPYGRHLPLVLTDEAIARFRKRADNGEAPDFLTEIWPLVAKEVETVYYEVLTEKREFRGPGEFRDLFLATAHRSPEEAAVLDEFGIAHADRWSWDRVSRPYAGQVFADPDGWRAWLLGHLRRDAAEAALGNVAGPLKAALDVLRDLRNELRQIVDHAGLAGASRRDHLDRWYTPLNAFLSIGPPRRRIEELTALVEAGVMEVLGPRLDVREEDGAWVAHSPDVPGSAVRVTTLVEARLPEPDLRHTTDDLLARLLKTGQCRPHVVDGYETGGLDVTRRPYHLIDRQGHAHPRRFAFGVPTEGVHWVTAAGARPGVDSVTLSDADAVARAALRAATAGTEGKAEAKQWPNVELASVD